MSHQTSISLPLITRGHLSYPLFFMKEAKHSLIFSQDKWKINNTHYNTACKLALILKVTMHVYVTASSGYQIC